MVARAAGRACTRPPAELEQEHKVHAPDHWPASVDAADHLGCAVGAAIRAAVPEVLP
jgi:hypothetical protein